MQDKSACSLALPTPTHALFYLNCSPLGEDKRGTQKAYISFELELRQGIITFSLCFQSALSFTFGRFHLIHTYIPCPKDNIGRYLINIC